MLAYLPGEPAVYLIEEPEDGLHPKAIEGVFDSLSSVYGGQVIVATHSPLLVGLSAPNQLLCFSRSHRGDVEVVRGDRHPALSEWRGQVDLATLFASGVLG
jgi:predicted ATPase